MIAMELPDEVGRRLASIPVERLPHCSFAFVCLRLSGDLIRLRATMVQPT